MFKVILSAIFALGVTSVAFAQSDDIQEPAAKETMAKKNHKKHMAKKNKKAMKKEAPKAEPMEEVAPEAAPPGDAE
jgi:hypothetical protein